ncbi:TIGR02281 family clan AA aspartic protease [Mesorhizobium sp. CN2-181]|uniref:TIGR02281 family clan AA aspartic protease n=1 Tax=Mesorhizobium yinganensis TaxID=3157707 RepID=UPI0032B77A3D
MLRSAILIGICIGSSAAVPLIYQSNPAAFQALLGSRAAEPTTVAELPPIATKPMIVSANPAPSGRKVQITADDRGHYVGNFKINGRKVEAMIDTGATAVAFNLSTARRLGLQVKPSDMKNTVNTANGQARATMVMVDRLEIGRIAVENVQALVLEDQALNSTLIGMTFLNRLKKFQVDQGTLLLVQ